MGHHKYVMLYLAWCHSMDLEGHHKVVNVASRNSMTLTLCRKKQSINKSIYFMYIFYRLLNISL